MADLSLLATAGEIASWKHNDQEAATRDRHELSATSFWAKVNALIDTPEALKADPLTTRRLLRLRDTRQRVRR